jgi:dTDP-4-amino-4,6-dideoxygalactose transaminase
MDKIQVLKPKYRTEEILKEIQECLDTSWTGMGGKAIEFEEKWKDYADFEHAHFLQSATAGLHLALKVFKEKYGWEDGDEIITTPLTFVSTNHAIMYENLKPVFADVDDSLCLDPDSILSNITDKTRAVMFVGIGGNIGQYERVREICNLQNIPLILDAAHLAGTQTMRVYPQYQAMAQSQVGWDADVSVFSFQAVKNLPTADSGMICFKDEEDDKLARQLSWLGIDKSTYDRYNKGTYNWKYDVPNVGYKYHGNALMGAIGLVQLKYLDEDNQYRNLLSETYDYYFDILNLKSIQEVKNNLIKDSVHSRHLYPIRIKKGLRDFVMEELSKRDIYCGVHYLDNTQYPMYNYAHGTCKNAHEISSELISLPLHLHMSKDDVKRIVIEIADILPEYDKDKSITKGLLGRADNGKK